MRVIKKELKPRTQVNTSHVGCIGELLVTIDLMRRGYEIFRGISPACRCDLIAIKEKVSRRIEVTKGYRPTLDKTLKYRRHNVDNYDVMAIWEDDGLITYLPELEIPKPISTESHI